MKGRGYTMKPRKLYPGELAFIIFLGIISILAFILSLQMFLKKPSLSGQGAFPLLTTSVMLLMELLMLWEMRKCERAAEKGTSLSGKLTEVVHTLFPGKIPLIMAYVLIYAILLPIVGFIPATYVFLWGSMVTLNRSKILQSLLISGGVLVFIYVVFQFIFKVILP